MTAYVHVYVTEYLPYSLPTYLSIQLIVHVLLNYAHKRTNTIVHVNSKWTRPITRWYSNMLDEADITVESIVIAIRMVECHYL